MTSWHGGSHPRTPAAAENILRTSGFKGKDILSKPTSVSVLTQDTVEGSVLFRVAIAGGFATGGSQKGLQHHPPLQESSLEETEAEIRK